MKNIKLIFAAVVLCIFTNSVIAENQRMLANPNVNTEVRSTEDKVNDSRDFISINQGDNAAKMSSVSPSDKNKSVTIQVVGAIQLQSNHKESVKKYNRSSNIQGEKKNRVNR